MGLRPTQGDEKRVLFSNYRRRKRPREESWAFGPPKAMKNGSCSATTVAGSAALPFVISTGAQRSGEICGVRGPFLGNVCRPEKSWAEGPPKAMKNGSCSATTVAGSAALSFVISTGGVVGLRPTQGDEKRVLFSNYCCWKRRPLLCHLDRSSVPGFPTSRCSRGPRVRLSLKRAACRSSTPLFSTGNPGGERSGELCGVSGPFLE